MHGGKSLGPPDHVVPEKVARIIIGLEGKIEKGEVGGLQLLPRCSVDYCNTLKLNTTSPPIPVVLIA